MKIPTILHESNAFPGKAVKMLSRITDTILVGYKEAKKLLPNANRIIVTGNPTKIKNLNLTQYEKEIKIKNIGLNPKMPIVLVFGGSQGAKAINDAVVKIINERANKNYQIIWAAGPVQYNIIKEELNRNGINIENIENTKIYPYIYNMEEIMNIADLFICRSGAMTINEVSQVGKPAIFIPLPGVSQNHQEYNARVLEKVGAANIILNKDLESTNLNKYIENIIYNKELLKTMGENAKKISKSNVIDNIYKEIKYTILHKH